MRDGFAARRVSAVGQSVAKVSVAPGAATSSRAGVETHGSLAAEIVWGGGGMT